MTFSVCVLDIYISFRFSFASLSPFFLLICVCTLRHSMKIEEKSFLMESKSGHPSEITISMRVRAAISFFFSYFVSVVSVSTIPLSFFLLIPLLLLLLLLCRSEKKQNLNMYVNIKVSHIHK